ncbi:MAG: MBL fold metallo-hydrolase [Saprospirales bacterium]|nr:MAG: MBL fold metallo-hydrolase [Saprospirales bacterium]
MYELTFLGTGTSQGIPVIGCECKVCNSPDPRDHRLRTSALLKVGGKTFVFDAGPDFRQQMLRERVKNIDAILLTHEHNDHVIGLDDVRPFNFMHRKGIDIFGTDRVIKEVANRFPYVFEENPYPGAPQISTHLIEPLIPFNVNGTDFFPLPVLHGSWPVLGFKSGPVVYITDAKYIPEEVLDEIKGAEILVLNALRKKEHHSHLSLNQAIEISLKVGAKNTYITHVSHVMGLYNEVQAELPSGVYLAYDGLKVSAGL